MLTISSNNIIGHRAIPGGGGGGSGLTMGTTTISSSVSGRILYDSSGILSGNNNFYWDRTNARLGIGTTTPSTKLTIASATVNNTIMTLDGSSYTGGGNNAFVNFDLNNGSGTATYSSIYCLNSVRSPGSETGRLRFDVIENGSSDERMTILGSRIGINNIAPDASAQLDVSSTTKGFLPPRMTTTQRNAISSPVEGLHIYNTTTHKGNYYDGTNWVEY
jgi:hypothetical protein